MKGRGDDAFKLGNFREAWERQVHDQWDGAPPVIAMLTLEPLGSLHSSFSMKLPATAHKPLVTSPTAAPSAPLHTSICRYSEALELQPDRAALPALHSNRSAAYCKAGRHAEALADADEAARLAPGWHKAHWRRGAALLALKRGPEAVLAYREAWQLAAGSKGRVGGGSGGKAASASHTGSAGDAAECQARLWDAVQRLTREQLGRGLLATLAAAQAAGQLAAPAEEEASDQELAEACFRMIKQEHQGIRPPGPCHRRCVR